jgi:hypothetical protein
MPSQLSRRIARRDPNRPARPDKSQPEIDASGPKSGPKNTGGPVIIGFLEDTGGGAGAQERMWSISNYHAFIEA